MHPLFITFFRSFKIFFFSNMYFISKILFVSTPSSLSFIFVVIIKARISPMINIHTARNVKLLLFPARYATNDVAENIVINIAREMKRFIISSPPSASSTAADHGASSRGAAPWLKAACSPGCPFPRHTAARYGQLHSLPASAQVPSAAGRPVLGRVTSLGGHRPPVVRQGSILGAGRKTGVSWRQATTRQGAGAMGWKGMDGAVKLEAGCARGHIVGEGIRPNWAHLAHF